MEKLTITEALAEIKLIEKKLVKKKEVVNQNLFHPSHVEDAFAKEGGSKAAMAKEMQSIRDLEERKVSIRSAIANQQNRITLGETTRSIYDWLTWKREISENRQKFLNDLQKRMKSIMDDAASKPNVYKDSSGEVQVLKFEPSLEYPSIIQEAQRIGDLIETLDGKLSLKNATITVDIH